MSTHAIALSIVMEPISVGAARAAELTDTSESTIRQMVADGRLVAVPHVGRRVLISVEELRRVFGSSGTS